MPNHSWIGISKSGLGQEIQYPNPD